jgi:hypothetical protein
MRYGCSVSATQEIGTNYANTHRLSNLFGDREQAILASNHYAIRARQTLDIDEPQLNNLMALLLLSQHAYQSGQGKKAYMCLCK